MLMVFIIIALVLASVLFFTLSKIVKDGDVKMFYEESAKGLLLFAFLILIVWGFFGLAGILIN